MRKWTTLKFTAMPFGKNQSPSGFHGVNELLRRCTEPHSEDDQGVTEGREDVREVFQQRGSGVKRKLSRCGRNQLEALSERDMESNLYGINDVLTTTLITREGIDHRGKMMDVCYLSEFDFEAKYHLGKANVDVVPWSRKKE
ncbi:hypothetical protein Tco_0592854 [Tanacetum coccineum]